MNWFLGLLLDLLITVIIALLPYVFVKLLTHGEIKPKTAKILTIIFSIVSFIIFSILTLISEQTLANIIPIIIWNRVGYNLIKPIEPIEGLIKCNHCGHTQSKDIEICEVCGKLTNSEKESQLSTANKCKKIDFNTEIRELYNTYKQDKNSLEQKDIYRLSYDFKNRASKQHTALKYAEKFIISFSGDNTKFNGYLICDEENNMKEFNVLVFEKKHFTITLQPNDTVYYINCQLNELNEIQKIKHNSSTDSVTIENMEYKL